MGLTGTQATSLVTVTDWPLGHTSFSWTDDTQATRYLSELTGKQATPPVVGLTGTQATLPLLVLTGTQVTPPLVGLMTLRPHLLLLGLTGIRAMPPLQALRPTFFTETDRHSGNTSFSGTDDFRHTSFTLSDWHSGHNSFTSIDYHSGHTSHTPLYCN